MYLQNLIRKHLLRNFYYLKRRENTVFECLRVITLSFWRIPLTLCPVHFAGRTKLQKQDITFWDIQWVNQA